MQPPFDTVIHPQLPTDGDVLIYPAEIFPWTNPVHWLNSHFAVGGWSPLQRLSGMITAHMTDIAPHNGFTWHPHRGLEIYTWVLEGELYHEDTTGGRGTIAAGELQRMFSGNWIEHQELNRLDAHVRVIQIWFAAKPEFRDLAPHYQQVARGELPVKALGDAEVRTLIGSGSPINSHVAARLTAVSLPSGGTTALEPPQAGEDMLTYVTDGTGVLRAAGQSSALGLYDVIVARPNAPAVEISADRELQLLNFYLPRFLPQR